MRFVRGLMTFVVSVALAVSFVAAGFVVCIAPPVTDVLSSKFARSDISPFNTNQLARVAQATRDFSFGSHSELSLYQTIFEVNNEYQRAELANAEEVPFGFPKLSKVGNFQDITQLRAAFEGASEQYCFSKDSISHLDDCYAILRTAKPILIACSLCGVTGLLLAALIFGKKQVSSILTFSGGLVIAVFLVLGVWAVLDFNGLFTTFHHVLFSQGNWQFPYDSLLICSLPTEFWMGMGGVWLVTSLVCSLASVIVGRKLR